MNKKYAILFLVLVAGAAAIYFYYHKNYKILPLVKNDTESPAPSANPLCTALPRIPAPQNTAGISNGPIISFNFDDGFLSSYEKALPIFNKAGFKTTWYIVSGFLNKSGSVSTQQVFELANQGHEIGAHTRTHPYLTRESIPQAVDEICGSRRDLLDKGLVPLTFAYPEGAVDPEVEDLAKEAGFIGARITKPGFNTSSTDKFLLWDYNMSASTTFAQVKKVIDKNSAQKSWLILVFHRTDEKGNGISVSHQLIQQIVNYVQTQKIPVVTNTEGLSILSSIAPATTTPNKK